MSLTSLAAQVSTTLTDQNRAEIQARSAAYRPALFGCKGRYDDLYVKTPQGWRIKERKYFPPEKGK